MAVSRVADVSDFAGLWWLDGRPVDQSDLDRLARLMDGRDIRPARFWRSGSIGLAHRQHWFTPEDMNEAMPLAAPSGRILIADCRLGDRSDLAEALGIALDRYSDGDLIAAAIDRWGSDAIGRFVGDFALASWNSASRSLLLARDHAGYKTLYMHRGPECIAFSTRLRPLLGLADIPDTLDEAAVADFLILNHGSPERTLYKAIERVPMGHLALITADRTELRRHWSPPAAGSAAWRSDQDVLEAARDVVDRAVADALRARGPATLLLTGGLDSAAIAESATRMLAPAQLLAATRKPDGAIPTADASRYFDETDRTALLAGSMPGLDWHSVGEDGGDWGEHDPRRFFLDCAAPTRALHNIQWFFPIYRFMARRGSRVTIGGEQGNTYFSDAGLGFLPDMALRGRWIALFRELKGLSRMQGRSMARLFLHHVARTFEPLPMRQRRSGIAGPVWRRHSALDPVFAEESGFAGSVDLARYRMRLGAGHRSVDTMRAWIWQDETARDVRGGFRAITGTDHRLPLADRRVVEFFGSLPREQFLRNGTTRYLARQLLSESGTVPPVIARSQASGKQNGDWFDRISAQRAGWRAAIDSLRDHPDASRLVDLSRIEALLDDWPSDAEAAEPRRSEYLQLLSRGMEVAQFLAWHRRSNSG